MTVAYVTVMFVTPVLLTVTIRTVYATEIRVIGHFNLCLNAY